MEDLFTSHFSSGSLPASAQIFLSLFSSNFIVPPCPVMILTLDNELTAVTVTQKGPKFPRLNL